MAFGIQCWNAAGALTMSLESRLLRYHGVGTFPVIPAGGYVDIPVSGMTTDGTWVAFTTSSETVASVFAGLVRVRNTQLSATTAGGTVIIARC